MTDPADKDAEIAAQDVDWSEVFPSGAIHNGRVLADRLEQYGFDTDPGTLSTSPEWQDLRRCFECLAEWAENHPSPASGQIAALKAEVARVTSESKRFAEDVAVQIAELMASCSAHRETARSLRARCDYFEGEKIAAEAEVARLAREHSAMLGGLSAIIHCQSHLSRREMRDAAATILDEAGLKPKWLDGDQSPFVLRAEAAEARVKELEGQRIAADRSFRAMNVGFQNAKQRVKELEAGLRPFADAIWNDDGQDDNRCSLWEAPEATDLTIGDLRQARALLSPKDKTNG